MKDDNKADMRPKGGMGNTNSAGVSDGVSSISQIKSTTADMGQAVGQGDRPKSMSRSKASHNGKTSTFR
jgi:hypothetical protein